MDRIILHVDVNNAFLSWTALWLLKNGYKKDIRNRFAIIGGDETERKGIVLAKSDLCKKNGVVTAEPIYSARRKCPYLEIYKPNFDVYKYYSDMMYDYLSTYTDIIERYSIDECFLDYTNSVNLFGDPVELAYKIKNDIYIRFGFTVNVGIGNNKLLAKMASDFEKPNKVHTLFCDEIVEKMHHLPVGQLFMIGKSSEKKLIDMNVHTIGQLALFSVDELVKRFKSMGILMHEYANGIDNSPVYYEKEAIKSVSASTVLPYNYKDETKIKEVIIQLSMDVGKKIRNNKVYADTVGVWLKYNYFDKISKQEKLNFSISTDEEISNNAIRIFNKLWNNEDGIRSICVFVSGLSLTRKKQLSLFDIDNCNGDKYEKDKKLQSVLDDMRNKYGNDIIKYGSSKKIEVIENE
jgi:DNA polymerase-4